ncbi:MAG: type II toxin-antitoxin system Phd/YefM family antitoxin [Desulfovibrionaceae bacterium]|nr:type II toxin-antitoxin system Phd/YefM family antitoxin [Desulfovibrionaceae bacterium]
MRPSQDIKPISYVKANSAQVLEQVNMSGPLVITQNGEAAAVLMGVTDYENFHDSLALLKILAMSKKSIEEGRGSPAGEVFTRLRAKREEKHNG